MWRPLKRHSFFKFLAKILFKINHLWDFLCKSIRRADYEPILKIANFRGNRIMTENFPSIFSEIGQGEMDDLKSIAELKSLQKLEKSLSKL